jgi:hypothetical protein
VVSHRGSVSVAGTLRRGALDGCQPQASTGGGLGSRRLVSRGGATLGYAPWGGFADSARHRGARCEGALLGEVAEALLRGQ